MSGSPLNPQDHWYWRSDPRGGVPWGEPEFHADPHSMTAAQKLKAFRKPVPVEIRRKALQDALDAIARGDLKPKPKMESAA